MSEDLHVSHTGGPGAYVGLIKRGDVVIWRCPHAHKNRDANTSRTAARPCAHLVLAALLDPAKAKLSIESLRNWNPHFRYDWQYQEHRATIARHEWALEVADQLRAKEAA